MDPLVCHNVIFFSKLSNNSCKNFVRLLHQERLDRAMLSINMILLMLLTTQKPCNHVYNWKHLSHCFGSTVWYFTVCWGVCCLFAGAYCSLTTHVCSNQPEIQQLLYQIKAFSFVLQWYFNNTFFLIDKKLSQSLNM